MRRAAPWLVALPLILAGTECAHALAYWVVYPVAAVRLQALADSGHGYLGYAPLVLGVGGAVAFAGLAVTAVDAARRRPSGRMPAWAFGLLPLVAYALQELIERWLEVRVFPWWMFEQPTFRVGLLLQVPFALLTYVGARVLRRVAVKAGRLIGADGRVPVVPVELLRWVSVPAVLPRVLPLAAACAGRAPPLSPRS